MLVRAIRILVKLIRTLMLVCAAAQDDLCLRLPCRKSQDKTRKIIILNPYTYGIIGNNGEIDDTRLDNIYMQHILIDIFFYQICHS